MIFESVAEFLSKGRVENYRNNFIYLLCDNVSYGKQVYFLAKAGSFRSQEDANNSY